MLKIGSLNVTVRVSFVFDSLTSVIIGAFLSNRFTELSVCALFALFAASSKILLSTGLIVKTSLPSGTPNRSMPSLYLVPLSLESIVDGAVFCKVADPPASESLKSSASKAPVALAVENTGTLNRTLTLLLSESSMVSVIIGALRS